MKSGVIFGLLIIGFALGFLADRQLFKPGPEIIENIKTEIIVDTLEVEKIIYKQLPAKLVWDTVFVDSSEHIVQTASADTVFEEYGELAVDYYFPPFNFFDIEFDPYPKQIIRETQFVKIKPRWYQSQKLGFFTGAAAVAVTVWLIK